MTSSPVELKAVGAQQQRHEAHVRRVHRLRWGLQRFRCAEHGCAESGVCIGPCPNCLAAASMCSIRTLQSPPALAFAARQVAHRPCTQLRVDAQPAAPHTHAAYLHLSALLTACRHVEQLGSQPSSRACATGFKAPQTHTLHMHTCILMPSCVHSRLPSVTRSLIASIVFFRMLPWIRRASNMAAAAAGAARRRAGGGGGGGRRAARRDAASDRVSLAARALCVAPRPRPGAPLGAAPATEGMPALLGHLEGGCGPARRALVSRAFV